MNFTATVKEEIFKKNLKDRCCKKAFLAGLIRGSGRIFTNESGLGFDFTLPDEESVIVISTYLKILYSFELREISVSEDYLNKKDKFILTVTGKKAQEILFDIGVLIYDGGEVSVNLKFFVDLTKKECCLRAFFRGLFIAVGSCTVPFMSKSSNTKYHLEMIFSHSTPATDVATVLHNNGVEVKITRRKDKYVLYIKSGEEIKNFLAFIGTPISVLKLTDMMVSAELANISNRRANCDLGNVTRQVNAYEKHVSAINLIKEKLGLECLKKDLYDVAVARLENPDENLNDLAQMLGITKSCLNHRLRKIVSIAEEL